MPAPPTLLLTMPACPTCGQVNPAEARFCSSCGRPLAPRGDAATGQTLVTGDAVNVAARLEQAAQPGEILIGDATYRVLRDGVVAELLPPLEVKGKEDLITAYRLIDVLPGAEAVPRRLDS